MRWTLDHRLATRLARFSLKPYGAAPNARLDWTSNLLVAAQPILRPDGTWQLEVRNLPPFHAEELMPPDEEVRPWLEFYYEISRPPHWIGQAPACSLPAC